MESTPVSLLQRLSDNSTEDDWHRLVDYCTPLLYAWARRAGLTGAQAADLVQDVFLILVKELPRFSYNPAGSFRAWLKTITLNKQRQNMRRQRPANAHTDGVQIAEPTIDAADEFWETEYREQLSRTALEFIQARFSQRVWAAFWETAVVGRPAAAVALDMDLSVGAVYASKCRVLKALRVELDGMLD